MDAQRSWDGHQQMTNSETTDDAQSRGEQVTSKALTQPQHQPRTLSGAAEVHAASAWCSASWTEPIPSRRRCLSRQISAVGPRGTGDGTTFRVGDGSG